MLMVPFALGFVFLGVCFHMFYLKYFNSNYPVVLKKKTYYRNMMTLAF